MPRQPTEIMEASARGRAPLTGEYGIEHLRRCWDRYGGEAEPFMDFIPIRLVTIFENSVRAVVARAVDYGQPYASRGLSLIARFSAKAIADTLLAMKEERITLGDLASHGFSTGRIDDIIAALTTIFGDDFRDELASIRTPWSEDEDQELPPIITDLIATIRCLDHLLQARHILVHEQPAAKPYTNRDVSHFFEHTAAFVSALEWILIKRLHGTVPRTQSSMNVRANLKMVEAQAELDALRGGTAADFADPKTPCAELEHHWDRYSQLSARIQAGYNSKERVGTIAPVLYAAEFTRLTRWRIDDIRWLKSRSEGRL
jgi:hypothetical protein